MTTYDIAIYSTKELQDWAYDNHNTSFYPATNAETIIKGAFDRISGHDVNITIEYNEEPDPPRETDLQSDSYTQCMCQDPYDTCHYNTILDWWFHWIDCWSEGYIATDTNILLTNADPSGAGGLAVGDGAVLGGQKLVDFNGKYERYGFQDYHNNGDNLLEELGHSLQTTFSDSEDEDNDGAKPHDSGTLFYHRYEGYTITPMGIEGDTDYNNCDEYVDKDRYSGNGWEMRYSNCAASFFEKKQ